MCLDKPAEHPESWNCCYCLSLNQTLIIIALINIIDGIFQLYFEGMYFLTIFGFMVPYILFIFMQDSIVIKRLIVFSQIVHILAEFAYGCYLMTATMFFTDAIN